MIGMIDKKEKGAKKGENISVYTCIGDNFKKKVIFLKKEVYLVSVCRIYVSNWSFYEDSLPVGSGRAVHGDGFVRCL
jgi:hypothetical protein